MADEPSRFVADKIRAAAADPLATKVVDREEPVLADDSRGRIRRFIWEGHPESGIEVPSAIQFRLGNGDPFPFAVAVIPAHNEQDSILGSIASLRSQTRRPDEIIVVANNCTDDTVYIAFAAADLREPRPRPLKRQPDLECQASTGIAHTSHKRSCGPAAD